MVSNGENAIFMVARILLLQCAVNMTRPSGRAVKFSTTNGKNDPPQGVA